MSESNIPYNYPLRESTAVIIMRILGLQAVVGLSGILLVGLLVFLIEGAEAVRQLPTYLLAIMIILQLVNALFLTLIILNWSSTVYRITPNEIAIQSGIYNIRRSVYRTERIESVNVEQSFLGKLFNYGTIKFYNPVLKEDVNLANVPDPNVYSEVIKRTESKEEIRFLPSRNGDDYRDRIV